MQPNLYYLYLKRDKTTNRSYPEKDQYGFRKSYRIGNPNVVMKILRVRNLEQNRFLALCARPARARSVSAQPVSAQPVSAALFFSYYGSFKSHWREVGTTVILLGIRLARINYYYIIRRNSDYLNKLIGL